MTDGVEVIGAAALAKGLQGSPQAMREGQRLAMALAMREVRAEAITNHRFTTRTGALERSVTSEAGIVGGEVVGRVFLNSGIAPYAAAVHNGWRREKPIIPKEPRRALHWVAGGQNIFRARVDKPASYKGDPFLFRAWEAKLEETKSALGAASIQAIAAEIGGK
jgi:hypothetical protein